MVTSKGIPVSHVLRIVRWRLPKRLDQIIQEEGTTRFGSGILEKEISGFDKSGKGVFGNVVQRRKKRNQKGVRIK